MENLSLMDPLQHAWSRMVRVCFKPFELNKWLTLGFCAWLANLGSGGGGSTGSSGNRNGGSTDGGTGGAFPDIGPFGDAYRTVTEFIEEHLVLIIVAAAFILILSFAIGLLLEWLRARGEFMLIDGIAHNRGAVVMPWKELGPQGNSLTLFRYLFGVVLLIALAAVVGLGFALGWSDIRAGEFSDAGITALIVTSALLFLTGLLASIIQFVLNALVVPAMYARRIGVLAGFGVVRREILAGNLGLIILFLILKIIVGICAAVVTVITVFATCCLVILPYVGSVILLPLYVFLKSFDLYFVEQFGQGFQIFAPDQAPAETGRCSGGQ